MPEEINSSDLYEGAYLLCRGLKLQGITVVGSNGKKLCSFAFNGDKAFQLVEEYREGKATVNVALLKFTLEKLKDQMFKKIRAIERQERRKCRTLWKKEIAREGNPLM